MNYQEYDWGNHPPTTPPAVDNINSENAIDPWSTIGLTCVGQDCCDTAFTYVPTSNKCMSNTNLPTGVSPYVPPSSSDSSSPL